MGARETGAKAKGARETGGKAKGVQDSQEMGGKGGMLMRGRWTTAYHVTRLRDRMRPKASNARATLRW